MKLLISSKLGKGLEVSSSLTNPSGLVDRAGDVYINGEWIGDNSNRSIDVFSPQTGEVITAITDSQDTVVDQAVTAARAATWEWARMTPKDRAARIMAWADRIDEDADNLVALETLNAGHPISTVPGEVKSATDRLRFFAGAGRLLEGRSAGEYAPGYTSIIRREPIGVAGLITPWNYPLLTAITKSSPALAAGNTVVLKPSEQTPLTTLRLAELSEGILPPGVFNVITGRGSSTGAALAAHPGIDIISLTGGTQTGRKVAEIAAATLKHVHLELGGKAPAIVLADADPAAVAESIKWAAFWNAGQDCSAATRIIVVDSAYREVLEALTSAIGSLSVGDPSSVTTEMGPLTYLDHKTNVKGFISRALDSGAQLELGGGEPRGGGYFLEPTILSGVHQDSEIVQSEVFGPVITIQQVSSDWEAIDLANAVEYGLGASVYTENVGVAMEAARRLQFGTVWINDHGAVTAEMPWGGFKQSGYGKERSVYSLEDYTQIKHVMVRLPH